MAVNDIETIYDNLALHLNGSKTIYEYDLISFYPDESPFINEENRLAINVKICKQLFLFVHDKCMKNPDETATRIFLMLNPEFMSVWNKRKDFIQEGSLTTEEDLLFMDLVLTKFPKSSATFSHRKYVLQTKLSLNMTPNKDAIKSKVLHELEICGHASERYANNYYSWSHRSWCLMTFEMDSLSLLVSEIYHMEQYCKMHVSDYSGFHYFEFLLNRLWQLSDVKTFLDIFKKAVEKLDLLMNFFEGHESLWCHRRTLFRFGSRLCSVGQTKHDALTPDLFTWLKTTLGDSLEMYAENEMLWCQKHVIGKCGWEQILANRFMQWLQRQTQV